VGGSLSSIATPGLWALFGGSVLGLLALDLFVFHRKSHKIHTREALAWSIAWIAAAVLFSGIVYLWFGSKPGLEFLTGYLIEKALAIDNLFVFSVIFTYFGIPAQRQHRVLSWGVFGALVFRAMFIALGSSLLARFHWLTYLLGAFLALTGAKLLSSNSEIHPERNPLFRALRKVIPTINVDTDQFFVREKAQLLATPLFLSLVLVEVSDIVFAVDSIPAVFAVTSDPFIVFTSNVFAVLGLRAMYSLLAELLTRLRYLRVGLALVLVFVGTKMLIQSVYEIPILVSLEVVALLLGGSALASIISRPAPRPTQAPSHPKQVRTAATRESEEQAAGEKPYE
jgi:tellurite resistance protein TerC